MTTNASLAPRSTTWRIRLFTLTACALLAAAASATSLDAQERGAPRVGPLSSQVTLAVVEAWNAPTTQRERGRFTITASDTVRRTLGVLQGPVIVSGTVLGDLVVINGDLRLDSTAVVQGSIVVVGGTVVGRSQGRVDGELQVWRSALAYREVDGRLVADENETFFSRYAEWRKRKSDAFRDVLVSSAHTYNRVEGLSILAGPRLRLSRGASRATFEALGIFRTGDRLAWERRNLGHQLLAEFREGTDARHIAFGAQHVDEVAAVESWSLGDAETGLTSLLFARDYRDYYNRLGGSAFVRAAGANGSQVQLSLGREEWESREARDPLALFRSGREWRVNPGALEGTATLFGVKGVIDTRNDPLQPRDGWLLSAEYERGHVDITRAADTTVLALSVPEITYGRLFVDARRYNRVSPHSSVNLRLVAGGLLHGDALPAQRKLSVSGVDALPGYGFRSLEGNVDVGMCNVRSQAEFAAAGRPAGCDAMMLLQAEWKGDFRIALFGANERTDARRWYADGLRADGTWIIFANSGRGWLVGDRDSNGDNELTYPRGSAPLFDGFRSDVGVGLDFGILGVYVAQPLQGDSNTPRVFVRLGARF